jgi:hypothetical protein
MSQEKDKRGARILARVKEYKQVFNSAAGQRVLQDLMQSHHMLSSSFNPTNSNETAFREGERNVVLRIFSILKIDPADLRKKIEERQENDY